MTYASFTYLGLFLVTSLIVYYKLPLERRWYVLLAGSCIFSILGSGWLFSALLVTAAVTWYAGIRLNRVDDETAPLLESAEQEEKKALQAAAQKQKHRIMALALLVTIGLLVFFKYYNFLGGALDRLLALLGAPEFFPQLKGLKLPLGISFYTLMAVSYILDVYRGKYRASGSFPQVLLFLSFFPEIVEGPFGRFDRLSGQLTEGHEFDAKCCEQAAELIIWGMFKKIVIADRAAALVAEVFSNHAQYEGWTVVFAAALYTLQIYADFSGMIDVSRGSAELFGVRLDANFERPFFSHNVGEFWRRWHITLGAWLRDYVFFPASLSQRSVKLRTWSRAHLRPFFASLLPMARALLLVWLCNGIWHGAGWKYIAYGLYYFALTMAGLLFEPFNASVRDRLHIRRDTRGYRSFQVARTLVLVTLGMMMFRADTLTDFAQMFRSIFAGAGIAPFVSGDIFTHGFDRHDLAVVAAGAALLVGLGLRQEKGHALRAELSQKSISVQWAVCLGMLFAVIILGAYGPGYQALDPIYGGF